MAQCGTALFALAWFAFPLEFVPLQNGWDNSLTIIVYPLLELLHYGTWPQLFHTLLTGLGELIADAGEPLSRALALPIQFLHHLQNLFSFVFPVSYCTSTHVPSFWSPFFKDCTKCGESLAPVVLSIVCFGQEEGVPQELCAK